MTRLACAYCDATENLRQHHDGGGYIPQDYVCENCFVPADDGPCFDDLPAVGQEPGNG